MKNYVSISLVLMFCFLVKFSETKSKVEQPKDDVIAEEYNFESKNGNSKGAISYGLASNNGYTIPEEYSNQYIAPTFVKKLPEKMEAPEPGPLESIDELPTTADYYDGSNKLNTVKVSCKVFTEPTDCFNQSSCGWCGSSNKCIFGNNMGPLQSCVKSSYIFSAPIPNFQNRTKSVEEKVGGMNLKIVNKKTEEIKK